jgi:hypothetical protein
MSSTAMVQPTKRPTSARMLGPRRFHRRAQLRSQTCNWVEQFCWHWLGTVVVPTMVTDGMTVLPLVVLMQVL